jgi:hypothetical protein
MASPLLAGKQELYYIYHLFLDKSFSKHFTLPILNISQIDKEKESATRIEGYNSKLMENSACFIVCRLL